MSATHAVQAQTTSAGLPVPWAGSQHGPVPCPWSSSGRAPSGDVQPWLMSCHENPTEIPALHFWALWGERQLAITDQQGLQTGLRGLRWSMEWPAHSGQCCCEQCEHDEPGSSSWARSLLGFKGHKDGATQTISFDLSTKGRWRASLVEPSSFCSIFSYLTITWLHPLYVGKAYNNLGIFPAVSWKPRTPVKGTVLSVGHGNFSWQWQGLPVTLAFEQELWHTEFNASVQKMPGKEMGGVGW